MPKVFLSAGHGGSDPGALGNGLREKDINLGIMLACRDVLERHGLTVICSRTKDEDDPVQQEVREANASGADVAVSFHTNAGGGDGSESFYWPTSTEGKRLAQLCEKHIKAIGQNSRGVKTNDLMFTRETNMTAVLCECAFIDTKKDIAIVDTAAEQQKFGEAYAAAILEYFGIEAEDWSDMATKAEIQEAVWGKKIDGKRADALLALNGSTTDPTGRGMNLNDHDHIKWIAATLVDLKAEVAALRQAVLVNDVKVGGSE